MQSEAICMTYLVYTAAATGQVIGANIIAYGYKSTNYGFVYLTAHTGILASTKSTLV